MIQVRPELPALHRVLQGHRGRRNDAHVNVNFVRGPHPPDLSLLHHPQQLALQPQGKLVQFVEKERAVVGELQQAQAAALRAGKRAALVSEELALEQFLGNRAAIDRRERLVFALAPVMNRVRHQLLAVPVSPTISTSKSVSAVRWMRSHTFCMTALLPSRSPQQYVRSTCRRSSRFSSRSRSFSSTARTLASSSSAPKRLGQVVHRPEPHALDRRLERRIASDNQRGHAGVALARLAEQFNPAELGHPNVRNEQIEAFRGEPLGGARAAVLQRHLGVRQPRNASAHSASMLSSSSTTRILVFVIRGSLGPH